MPITSSKSGIRSLKIGVEVVPIALSIVPESGSVKRIPRKGILVLIVSIRSSHTVYQSFKCAHDRAPKRHDDERAHEDTHQVERRGEKFVKCWVARSTNRNHYVAHGREIYEIALLHEVGFPPPLFPSESPFNSPAGVSTGLAPESQPVSLRVLGKGGGGRRLRLLSQPDAIGVYDLCRDRHLILQGSCPLRVEGRG